jgi:hypothetical protein
MLARCRRGCRLDLRLWNFSPRGLSECSHGGLAGCSLRRAICLSGALLCEQCINERQNAPRAIDPAEKAGGGGLAIARQCANVNQLTHLCDSSSIVRAADFARSVQCTGLSARNIKKLDSEDQKTFRRWLWGMICVLALVVCGLLAIGSSITLEQRSAILLQAGMFP